MYFEDTVTYFDIIVMFSHRGSKSKNRNLSSFFILPNSKHFISFLICSAEDLFTLISDKFRMVYKVDGNPQLDSHDWSMYF